MLGLNTALHPLFVRNKPNNVVKTPQNPMSIHRVFYFLNHIFSTFLLNRAKYKQFHFFVPPFPDTKKSPVLKRREIDEKSEISRY